MVNQGNPSLTYDLTTVTDGQFICIDPITSFAITSSGGWMTEQTQTFKYQSFRWSTVTDAVEQQTLRCTIKLEYDKSAVILVPSITELVYYPCSV